MKHRHADWELVFTSPSANTTCTFDSHFAICSCGNGTSTGATASSPSLDMVRPRLMEIGTTMCAETAYRAREFKGCQYAVHDPMRSRLITWPVSCNPPLRQHGTSGHCHAEAGDLLVDYLLQARATSTHNEERMVPAEWHGTSSMKSFVA